MISILQTKNISEMKPENLVNLKNLKIIPKVIFDKLIISGSMNIRNVNKVNLEWFFKSRVLRKSDNLQTLQGIYHFQDLHLKSKC